MKEIKIYSLIGLVALLTACTSESLKERLVRQEQSVETYIKGKIDSGEVKADSVFHNDGVYRLVYVSGTGVAAASRDSVIFYYKAYHCPSNFSAGNCYDSTRLLYPEKGILGAGHYISGLEKGLVGTKANEVAEILLTGAQAYGNVGMGLLPSYAPVKFEIKMLNVVKK